jgi:Domain of unknown function (DUF4835)
MQPFIPKKTHIFYKKHEFIMKKMKKYFFPFFLFCLLATNIQAQEIFATVKVLTPQLQKTDRKIIDALETSLKDLINTTKWTDDVFEPFERIKCTFTLTIKSEVGDNGFSGELSVQATRQVYGSGYESPLISHLDKDVEFTYDQFQSIDFARDNIDNNLSAIVAFYVYTILGLDYDSFSLLGGDQHHATALQIINTIPPGMANRFAGWRASDGGKNRNRYWINENLMSPRVKPLRSAMYLYHRKGLDMMGIDVEKGKASVLAAIEEIEKVNTTYFNSMIVQMFSSAKREEIVEMWKQGTRPQRDRIFQVMSKIDPANTQRYRDMGI